MKSWTLRKFLLLGLLGLSAVSAAGCANNNDETESPTREEYKSQFEQGQKGYCEKVTQTCETQEPAEQPQISLSGPFNDTVLCQVKGIIDGNDELLMQHCGGNNDELKEKYKALKLPECESKELQETYMKAKATAKADYPNLPAEAPNLFCIEYGFANAKDQCIAKGYVETINASYQQAFDAETTCADKESKFKPLKTLYANADCDTGDDRDRYNMGVDAANEEVKKQVKDDCMEPAAPAEPTCKELGIQIGQQWGLKTGDKVCTLDLKLDDSGEEVDYSRCSASANDNDRLDFEDGLAKGFIETLTSSDATCKIETEEQQAKNNQTCDEKVQKTLPEACTDEDVKELASCYQEKLFTCDYSAKSCVEEKVSADCRAGLDLAPLEVKPQTTQE